MISEALPVFIRGGTFDSPVRGHFPRAPAGAGRRSTAYGCYAAGGHEEDRPIYAERPSEKYLHGGCISIGGLIKTQVGGYNHP